MYIKRLTSKIGKSILVKPRKVELEEEKTQLRIVGTRKLRELDD